MEDTRPKFLNSVTEHPDVQRLIKQITMFQIKYNNLKEVVNLILNENFSGQSTLSPYAKRKIKEALEGD